MNCDVCGTLRGGSVVRQGTRTRFAFLIVFQIVQDDDLVKNN